MNLMEFIIQNKDSFFVDDDSAALGYSGNGMGVIVPQNLYSIFPPSSNLRRLCGPELKPFEHALNELTEFKNSYVYVIDSPRLTVNVGSGKLISRSVGNIEFKMDFNDPIDLTDKFPTYINNGVIKLYSIYFGLDNQNNVRIRLRFFTLHGDEIPPHFQILINRKKRLPKLKQLREIFKGQTD